MQWTPWNRLSSLFLLRFSTWLQMMKLFIHDIKSLHPFFQPEGYFGLRFSERKSPGNFHLLDVHPATCRWNEWQKISFGSQCCILRCSSVVQNDGKWWEACWSYGGREWNSKVWLRTLYRNGFFWIEMVDFTGQIEPDKRFSAISYVSFLYGTRFSWNVPIYIYLFIEEN